MLSPLLSSPPLQIFQQINQSPMMCQFVLQFIEEALFCSTSLALSYTDPDQKWIIRKHLISLFQNYPSLNPSVGLFTHNDGTEVKLLNANGELHVCPHAPPVPLTIWIHEFYPHMAPIVYINLQNCVYPVYDKYPFADSSSGSTTSSYLINWHFTKSNLSGLALNLVNLFSYNHPFYYSDRLSTPAHPSTVSKMEAMDRLVCSIYYDTAAITADTEEQIINLAAIQIELKKRGEDLETVTSGLERENRKLKERVEEFCEESDKALNWFKVYEEINCGTFALDDAFECLDWESEIKLECLAADLAVEDLMYKLDKTVGEGVLSFDVYMKQVRILGREQFFQRAKLEKIASPKGFPFV